MKLSNLRQGMVCKLRNGDFITILEDERKYNYSYSKNIHKLIDNFNDDLTHKKNKGFDIMEIIFDDYLNLIDELFGDKVLFKRKESRWFVPEVGETYYYTENSGTNNFQYKNGKSDDFFLKNNRVFGTYKEVAERLRQQQATLSVERWIAENDVEVDVNDRNVLKCSLCYDVGTKELGVISSPFYIYMPKQFILSSPEKANQLIKEREKELKIMLGVEE